MFHPDATSTIAPDTTCTTSDPMPANIFFFVISDMPIRPYVSALVICFFCVGLVNVQAETLYVKDTLRVKLHPEASTQSPTISVVTSGTALKLLERQQKFFKVTTPDGKTGWIRNTYLMSDKSASIKLTEASDQINTLQI